MLFFIKKINGLKEIGENCTQNDDCAENYCFNNKCIYNHGWRDFGEDCYKDSDCASLNCNIGKCSYSTFYYGHMCDDNKNCHSNYCVNWKCNYKVKFKIKKLAIIF